MAEFYSPVDFNRNEARGLRLESLAGAPEHGAGILYFDATAGRAYISDGTAWLPFGGIADGAIGTPKIADDAVTQAKLADNSVGTAQLIDSSVTAGKIVDGSITGGSAGAGVKIAPDTITNANIASGAAIAKTKLAPLNIVNGDVAAAAAISYGKLALTGSVINTDIAANAAIAKSKLAPLGIVNADVASGAAIARSKLDFGTGLTNVDLAANAAIALSKLAVDPLDRGNHTGTQLAETISDFAASARAAMTKATIDALDVDAETLDGLGANAFEKVSAKNAPNGYAGLDGTGKIPDGLLPALAITDTHVVASEAAMLALAAQTGDVAIRTDNDTTYILTATPATNLANWETLRTPDGGGGTVTSVSGAAPITSTGGVNPTIGLDDDGVQTQHIAPSAVGTTEIGNLQVTQAKLAANSVDASKIVDGSVGTSELGASAVTTVKVGDGQITNAKLAAGIDVAKVTGAVRKFVATIGDGVATSFVVNHALNAEDVQAQVSFAAGTKEIVYPDIRRTDANNVTVVFTGHVPAIGEFRVNIQG